MKYEIFINGGFANIPKQYEGELNLKDSEKKELFESLNKKPEKTGEIHDGFIYHIKIIEGSVEAKSVFNEHNLPKSVRKLLESITQP